MARSDLLVPSASQNPFANNQRPASNPTIAFAVRNPRPEKDGRHALRILANLIALAVGVAFIALFCKPQLMLIAFVPLMLLPVFILVMLIEQSLRVLPTMLVSLSLTGLWAFATHSPYAVVFFSAGGILLLHYQAFDFRRHYIAVATAGMLDEKTIRDFRRHHRLPKGLKRKSTIGGFFDAVVSCFSYNRNNVNVPGTLRSPAGLSYWRLSKTALCITILSFSSTLAFFAPVSTQFAATTDNVTLLFCRRGSSSSPIRL